MTKGSAYDYQCLKSVDKGCCSVLMSAAVVNDLIYSILLVSHAHPSIITSISYLPDCVHRHIQGVLKISHTHTCWWNCGEAARLLLLWLVSDNQMWKGQKDALFAFKSEHKSTKKTHPCVEADTEDCKHFASRGIISKMALRWHRGDVTVPNYWIKSLFLFYFRTKNILVAS